MAGFFVPLFLAALLGVVVQPLYRWILAQCRGYRHLAAGITTTLVAVMILLPIGFVVTTATLEGLSLLDELQLADVRLKLDQFRRDFSLQIPFEQDVRHIEATLRNWRDRQRSGEPLDVQPAQVHNLQVRLQHMKDELKKEPESRGAADRRGRARRPAQENRRCGARLRRSRRRAAARRRRIPQIQTRVARRHLPGLAHRAGQSDRRAARSVATKSVLRQPRPR